MSAARRSEPRSEARDEEIAAAERGLERARRRREVRGLRRARDDELAVEAQRVRFVARAPAEISRRDVQREIGRELGDERVAAASGARAERARRHGQIRRSRRAGDRDVRARPADAARFLVAAHYLGGQKYEDLAQALDLPIGTVKTHLHRAKRRLRTLLERA